jgi:ABC-type transport system involved in multi-copper enzyme maturation permease subunit
VAVGRLVPTRRGAVDIALVVGPQVLAIVALSVVCFALAYVAFMRQEVRA